MPSKEDEIISKIEELRSELAQLQAQKKINSVIVPEQFKPVFDQAEKVAQNYYKSVELNPSKGEILINSERFILMRSASLSYEFFDVFKELYHNRPAEEAMSIGKNFLFDISHVLGKKDAKSYYQKQKLNENIDRLAAGPVNFAHMGWAKVEVLEGSNPSPDENYFLKYHHHNSFEAEAWIDAGRKSKVPVCIMNGGYSSGWCEESYGMELTAFELTCRAKGDDHCTFVMGSPSKIQEYLKAETKASKKEEYDIPEFFKRKLVTEQLHHSLKQKDALIKEVHHRVKNNLQIITSLLKLQKNQLEDEGVANLFNSSIARVNIMANVHEMVYANTDVDEVNIEDFINYILSNIIQLNNEDKKLIETEVEVSVQRKDFPIDYIIPLGLIMNELVSNAFQHAFVPNQGKLSVSLNENEGLVRLIIKDNGSKKFKQNKIGLGLSLVEVLVDQISGDINTVFSEDGYSSIIQFKLD